MLSKSRRLFGTAFSICLLFYLVWKYKHQALSSYSVILADKYNLVSLLFVALLVVLQIELSSYRLYFAGRSIALNFPFKGIQRATWRSSLAQFFLPISFMSDVYRGFLLRNFGNISSITFALLIDKLLIQAAWIFPFFFSIHSYRTELLRLWDNYFSFSINFSFKSMVYMAMIAIFSLLYIYRNVVVKKINKFGCKFFILGLFVALALNATIAIQLFLIGKSMGLKFNLFQLLSVFPLFLAFMALPVGSQGIGLREAILVLLSPMLAMTEGQAVAMGSALSFITILTLCLLTLAYQMKILVHPKPIDIDMSR